VQALHKHVTGFGARRGALFRGTYFRCRSHTCDVATSS